MIYLYCFDNEMVKMLSKWTETISLRSLEIRLAMPFMRITVLNKKETYS